ncbi:winged helix-turn-helix domain-containing protein [Cohnella sp.]|uniref:winged helix-turn-helix domain-containing protein n=1 Tax=Cohnella sp. TaxID=1883426 RepID=UPI003562BEDA
MKWDAGAYTVTWKGQLIVLLPKEYAVLHYFYHNAGQTLSREQLLDAVWTLESPVDRTVDDHVYRLRRKLARWAPAVQIDTVRGIGYRLQLKQEALSDKQPTFSEELRSIAGKYLRYGRGDALLTLARNKQVLGFDVDPTFQLLFRAMEGEGDVRFIVREEEGSFVDRAFLLLLLNQLIDPEKNREYMETVLRKHLLAQVWHNELGTMLIISMLMDWGELEAAKEKLEWLTAEVQRNSWEGLVPYVAILRLEYVLRAERWAEVEAAIKSVEERLKQYPYQREEGHYRILKGLVVYRLNRQAGLALIEQGLTLLKQSKFLANQLGGYHTLLTISKLHGWGSDRVSYVKEWSRLTARIGLDEISGRVGEQLKAQLDSL